MIRARSLVLLAALVSAGCATTSAVMLEGGGIYPATDYVQILTDTPSRPFKQIAMLEARGPVGTSTPDLLESMKRKAAEIGADAIIPTEDASTQQQTGLMYNPWLGGYQTIGGATIPGIRGFAIKYID